MTKILVGYARVSSNGQSLELQLDKLRDCPKIFQEKASGLDGKRSQLYACLEYLREGDTLVVSELVPFLVEIRRAAQILVYAAIGREISQASCSA